MWVLLLFLFFEALCFIAGLIMGLWGLGVIPEECDDPDIRNNLRRLLVVSAIGLTAVISMGLCHYYCLLKSNIGADKSNSFETKPLFMIFILALNLSIIGFAVPILKFVDDGKCKNTETETFKTTTQSLLAISGFSALLNLVLIGYHYYKEGDYEREAKLRGIGS